jgi:hypothetical protein
MPVQQLPKTRSGCKERGKFVRAREDLTIVVFMRAGLQAALSMMQAWRMNECDSEHWN